MLKIIIIFTSVLSLINLCKGLQFPHRFFNNCNKTTDMNTKEIWKDIPNYEGLYQVSNLGRVKSLGRIVIRGRKSKQYKKENILKYRYSGREFNKYVSVALFKNGKRSDKKVHQLMAVAFLNHKPDGHKIVVDHINNIPNDNRLENLQLITNRENLSKDKNGSSKYVGVRWDKERNKWASQICINGKQKFLGRFKEEIDAHLAYQNKLKEINNGIV